MKLNDKKIIVAIENAVCEQLEASGIKADPIRLDGEKIVDVILEQLDWYVLVPKYPTCEMIEAGSDTGYRTGGHIESIWDAMIEAQEPAK